MSQSEASNPLRPEDTRAEAPEAGAGQAERTPGERISGIQEQVGTIQQRLKAVEAQLAKFADSDETSPEEAALETQAQALVSEMERLTKQADGLDASDAEKPAVESTELVELGKALDQLYTEKLTDDVVAQIRVIEKRVLEIYATDFAIETASPSEGEAIPEGVQEDPSVLIEGLNKRLDALYSQPPSPQVNEEIYKLQRYMSGVMEKQGLVREPDPNAIPTEVLERPKHDAKTAVMAEQGRQAIAADEHEKKKGFFQAAIDKAAIAVEQAKAVYDNRVKKIDIAKQRLSEATTRRAMAEGQVGEFASAHQRTKDELDTQTKSLDQASQEVLSKSEKRVFDAGYQRTRFLQEKMDVGTGEALSRQDVMDGRVERRLSKQVEALSAAYNAHAATKRPFIFGRKAWDTKRDALAKDVADRTHQIREVQKHTTQMRNELQGLDEAYATATVQRDVALAKDAQHRYETLQPLQQQLQGIEDSWRSAYREFENQHQTFGEEQTLLASITETAAEAQRALQARQQEHQATLNDMRVLETSYAEASQKSQQELGVRQQALSAVEGKPLAASPSRTEAPPSKPSSVYAEAA